MTLIAQILSSLVVSAQPVTVDPIPQATWKNLTCVGAGMAMAPAHMGGLLCRDGRGKGYSVMQTGIALTPAFGSARAGGMWIKSRGNIEGTYGGGGIHIVSVLGSDFAVYRKIGPAARTAPARLYLVNFAMGLTLEQKIPVGVQASTLTIMPVE